MRCVTTQKNQSQDISGCAQKVERLRDTKLGKQITICPVCNDVKYEDTWYAPDSKTALLANNSKKRTEIRHCPACEMKLKGFYSAVVVIHDVPDSLRDRVERLIESEAENAVCHNPQNRVLEIIETLDGYEVQTTTPEVARMIGGKIKEQFRVSENVTTIQKKSFPLHGSNTVLKISEYF